MSLIQKTFLAAVIPVVLLFAYIAPSWKPKPPVNPLLTIAVEHEEKMTLDLTVTRNGTDRLIEMKNDVLETIYVSTPVEWDRGEVRGAPIAEVTSTGPDAGYMRWTLPAGASVTFRTTTPFDRLRIDNPYKELMNVRFTQVDLQKNTAEHDSYLVKDNEVIVP